MGNPWVTRPLPAPTPAKNPYPGSWVWVPADTGMGSAPDPSTLGSSAWGLGGLKVSQGVARYLARLRGTRDIVGGSVVQRSQEQKWGRLVVGVRKQSCTLVRNMKLGMCGRLGRERVVFESLRPHANAERWGMQGMRN
ncbi:hypothetical protein EDB85DRAFT_1899504 [Lactarius pseudohatsudake]|nr:hypothetical protein EDB85DRAFT_1899504 [Lactarius pseudohatsudake]